MKSGLVGTAYTAWSKDLADQRCVNLYLETVETKTGAEPQALFGCPGLTLARTIGSGPVRALHQVGGQLYAVSANEVFRLDANLAPTKIGNMSTSSGLVGIVSNPTQIGFFDSVGAFSWDGTNWETINLPITGPIGAPVYQDGFVVISQPGTFNLWQSNLNDLTTWDPLNFTTEDGNAQPVERLVAFNDQIYVLKQFSFCAYVNAGLNGFVFERLSGVYPLTGLIAPSSVAVVANTLLWIGQYENGEPCVYQTRAYDPERASTYAIESTMAGYPTVSDAIGFSYTQAGHSFYVLTFPTGGETWVLDLTESRKIGAPAWHQRAGFSNGQFTRYAANCSTQFNGSTYVGDYSSGNIYKLDRNNFTDNNQTRKWLRSWRPDGPTAFKTNTLNYLDIQMETGFGVPLNINSDPILDEYGNPILDEYGNEIVAEDSVVGQPNPQVVLRQSFDGGSTWTAEMFRSAGALGQTNWDVRFNRLGSTRRGMNNDRVLELSSTDAFMVALLGAEIG
jgi:hypothetical protein